MLAIQSRTNPWNGFATAQRKPDRETFDELNDYVQGEPIQRKIKHKCRKKDPGIGLFTPILKEDIIVYT